jgi:hypothetical protein
MFGTYSNVIPVEVPGHPLPTGEVVHALVLVNFEDEIEVLLGMFALKEGSK